MTNIRTNLDRILLHVAADPGLNANIPQWQIAAGNAGASMVTMMEGEEREGRSTRICKEQETKSVMPSAR